MNEQDQHEHIADYRDGSGHYLVSRTGDTLTINFDGEFQTLTLHRAERYDAEFDPEFLLSDRYAADMDTGMLDAGVVWIDGLAFDAETTR